MSGTDHQWCACTPCISEYASAKWRESYDRTREVEEPADQGADDQVAMVRAGTRPGDNLADMLFSFLFSEAGKTEDLMTLTGKGSRAVRTEIFAGKDPTIHLQSDLWPTARLRYVAFKFHVFGAHLRKQIALDRRAYLQGLADNVKFQDVRNPKALYASVRKAFPSAQATRRKRFRCLPAVLDDNGQMVVTAADRIERWRDHFGQQEAGELVTEEQYLHHLQTLPKPRTNPVFDMRYVPTLQEVEAITLSLQRGKAAGSDAIAAEMLQVHTPSTARQIMGVFLKTAASLREPIQFKGGELVCLAKKAGAALQCQGYRSILISSIPGKIAHRYLRGHLITLLQANRPALQAGAIPGEGIEHISLAAQCFQQYAEATRRPWSLVFYDIQAAFYTVVRELITPHTHTDRELLALFHKLNLPPQAIHELRSKLESLALLPQLQAGEHLTSQVQELYRGTWFRITDGALITLTHRGTRPGDPAADAVFGLTMAALLHKIQTELQQQELLPQVPTADRPPSWAATTEDPQWGCPAWADDFVQPVDGDQPQHLLDRICQSVSIVAAQVSAFGMRLTYDREKTAAILPTWIPVHLPPQRVDQGGGRYLPIVDQLTQEHHELPIVDTYKHLGGILTADTSPMPDLHHRHAKAQAVVRPLRRKLFAARDIPLRTRRTLLRTLAISKFAHTGAALLLKAAFHRRVWAQQYVGLWRALFVRQNTHQSVHAYQVLLTAQAAAPPLALARARAGFLAKLARTGPSTLAHLLIAHWQQAPRTAWLTQLEEDYHAVVLYLPEVKDLLQSEPVAAIIASLSEDPKWWFKQTIRAAKVFHEDLVLWSQGSRGGPEELPVAVERPYACPCCPATFVLRKHLGVHMARSHMLVSPARHYAPTTHCLACLRHYGSVGRVQMHLKGHPQCLLRCAYLFPPMSHEDIARAEHSDAQARKRVKKGAWQTYEAPKLSTPIAGPPLPSADERQQHVDITSESTLLADLARHYRPKASTVAWITKYLADASREGPRVTSITFWGSRPRFTAPA
ncbi:unnamed protein product [Symbiodinium sp. CCMP2592]|nr:unnamed protein product [Symbiodinium sp. CCMP2592]